MIVKKKGLWSKPSHLQAIAWEHCTNKQQEAEAQLIYDLWFAVIYRHPTPLKSFGNIYQEGKMQWSLPEQGWLLHWPYKSLVLNLTLFQGEVGAAWTGYSSFSSKTR